MKKSRLDKIVDAILSSTTQQALLLIGLFLIVFSMMGFITGFWIVVIEWARP